jgi:lipoprotein-anchoring transpeptidase ErfK/SrfK
MEWWMAFTPDGANGLHALPYWLQADGSKRYEGERDLGIPASHGCIRQSYAEAKSLFHWADIGTTVIVHR